MAVKHNYLNVSDKKPTVIEIGIGELVPNFADGTLWTKDESGTVIKLEINTLSQNIDGGRADTLYGGSIIIDCGGA